MLDPEEQFFVNVVKLLSIICMKSVEAIKSRLTNCSKFPMALTAFILILSQSVALFTAVCNSFKSKLSGISSISAFLLKKNKSF